MATLAHIASTRSEVHLHRCFEDTVPKQTTELHILTDVLDRLVAVDIPQRALSVSPRVSTLAVWLSFIGDAFQASGWFNYSYRAAPFCLVGKDVPLMSIVPDASNASETGAFLMWTTHHVPGIAFLKAEFARINESFEMSPVCYNQALVCGIAAYCLRVLGRMQELQSEHGGILESIWDLFRQIGYLHGQYGGDERSDFALLDLQLIEDRFELLQRKCSEASVFPTLEEAGLDALLFQ